jgi:endonuclease/exonuclease/phosphatase (EEP) superfamily protein YafD
MAGVDGSSSDSKPFPTQGREVGKLPEPMVLSMLSRLCASTERSSRSSHGVARLTRRAVLAAGLSYAGGALGYAVLRPLLGDRKGWIELADDLEPWSYLPAPVLGIAGAALGSSALTAAGAALGAAFAGRWGYRYLRKTPPQPQALADLTVMTFNTLAWTRSAEDLEASIIKANPDLVGLQEIGPNAASYLTARLADRFPYQYQTHSPTPSGAAVLSRYPLRETVAFRASDNGHWWQRMIVDAPNGPITYFNIHTKIPRVQPAEQSGGGLLSRAFCTERRGREVRRLAEMLDKVEGPVIVCGDFNMTERSADYRLVATRLRDAYKAVGAGLGHTFPAWGKGPHPFPAPFPMLRLDYIWHSDHFSAAWASKGDAGLSDHHPIVVGLRRAAWAVEQGQRLPLAASAV